MSLNKKINLIHLVVAQSQPVFQNKPDEIPVLSLQNTTSGESRGSEAEPKSPHLALGTNQHNPEPKMHTSQKVCGTSTSLAAVPAPGSGMAAATRRGSTLHFPLPCTCPGGGQHRGEEHMGGNSGRGT